MNKIIFIIVIVMLFCYGAEGSNNLPLCKKKSICGNEGKKKVFKPKPDNFKGKYHLSKKQRNVKRQFKEIVQIIIVVSKQQKIKSLFSKNVGIQRSVTKKKKNEMFSFKNWALYEKKMF